jgi:hypothetical protein
LRAGVIDVTELLSAVDGGATSRCCEGCRGRWEGAAKAQFRSLDFAGSSRFE